MKTFAASVLLCVACCAAFGAETIPLFNGKDLSGWTFDVTNDADPKAIWSVQDGVITCKGKPSGVMRTTESYGNYELIVEWRWLPGSEGGNSGCLVHCSKPRELGIWPKSIEVQLASGNAGDFWVIGESIEVPAERKPKTGRRILNLTDNSEKPVGEWNTLRVRCEGRSIRVWVNGEKVNEGDECSASNGAICLQSEGTEIQFRKVELTPIE